MKKIIFRKFLYDCLIFFIIALISSSIIVWVFQAVNYLDLVIDDGRNYSVYWYYTLLNFPKILSKIYPFAFFFSFSYVIAKYELNNELIIFWNFGVNKMNFINFFFIISIILLFIQISLTAFVVPSSQNLAKSLVRVSEYNFVDNFIKIKKFNASVHELTIYTEDKDSEGNYNNIYIKKKNNNDDFQIIYAKKGIFKKNRKDPVLELFDGENTSLSNGKLTNFSFSKSEFNLNPYSTNTILVKKTQEHKTNELIRCAIGLVNKDIKNIKIIKEKVRNCEFKNLDNILAELHKRLGIPLYLPALMLTALLLIINSKEKINFSKFRLITFLIGFFIIIFSESTLRFIDDSIKFNIFIVSIPVISIIMFYFYFLIKLKTQLVK
ncbi:LptF/LptG family permease [Candidatus Pelagibacter sp. HIMB123]|uniref:LptF/LptG family permease n=1 Tax=Candidatus Pelagibacter sp. HIMB123 TaxID=3415413 RepID=UPI003F8526D9